MYLNGGSARYACSVYSDKFCHDISCFCPRRSKLEEVLIQSDQDQAAPLIPTQETVYSRMLLVRLALSLK